MATKKRIKRTKPRLWVGWREWVALPDLGIERIKAKVDTGAATSAIHAVHIRRFQENGQPRVRFDVHPEPRATDITIHCEADIIDERLVTSSNGHREKRMVIRTRLQVAEQAWPVEMTLTNRDTMGFRMLLGRSAMHDHLLVDPSASFMAGAADSELPAARHRNQTVKKSQE